ncbi:MAG: hypothetical protein WBM67_04705, partial [Sedimenticolaceae bacterium]
GAKKSRLCVANLRNSQLLRAIRALIRAFLITNLICPELLEVPLCFSPQRGRTPGFGDSTNDDGCE